MSHELWQQAKQALAEAMALAAEEREKFLANLQANSPLVHDEVVSLMSSQAAAEQQGFLENAAEPMSDESAADEPRADAPDAVNPDDVETLDQLRTETYDPARTNAYVSAGEHALPPPSAPGHPQGLVGEDYELEKKIGQGGMGVVYKAYHRSLRRTVALKIITGGGLRDEIDIARFHIEAEAAARLDHPGIIPVYDVGQHNGNHYYAMAYVEGPSLSAYVGKKAQSLAPRRAAELMEQVCRAVQYAHDRAVIHRDLKPANIMLENGTIPRLADFGLAKNMHEDDGLTMTGQVMGTPSYMAPEQATGKLHEISNRTDVYSLGATLYALLAGKPPFAGGTLLETIRQVVKAEPESLTLVSRPVPRDLQTICEKCLAKRPEQRYDSAEAVAHDLRRYLDGYPISARPLGPLARAMRWCRRNPLEAALLALTAATFLVASIISIRFGLEANRHAAIAEAALAEAQENAQQLRQSIKESFVFASEDVLAQEPGMQRARAVLLETAQRYYAALVAQTPRDAASQSALAEAQFMLGKILMAMGKDEEARHALDEALSMQKQLVTSAPENAIELEAFAKTHNQLARLAKKTWQGLTQLSSQETLPTDQAAEAARQLAAWQQHAAEVVRLRKFVVDEQPEDIESQRLLASATMNQGVAIGQAGYALQKLPEQDRAREIMLAAQQIRTDVLREHPEEQSLRRDLALGYFNLANTELGAAYLEVENSPQYHARLKVAMADLTNAIETFQQLPADDQTLDTQSELATCYRLRGDAQLLLNAEDAEESDYQRAEEILTSLASRNPNVYRYQLALAEIQFNRCNFLFSKHLDERGAGHFGACRSTLLQALRVDPSNQDVMNQLLRFASSIAESLAAKKDFNMADRLLQETTQDLITLRNESQEFAALQSAIDMMQAASGRIQQLRADAEDPDDVL